MSIQFRLTVMNFVQFGLWGAWLISFGAYMSKSLGFSGIQIGSIYGTMGVASMFMPGLMGIIADRWLNAERLYGILHLVGAGLLVWASTVRDYETLYFIMLFNAMVYMPTIALNNTISYRVLEQQGLNFIQKFPPIRVWGTSRLHRRHVGHGPSGSTLTTGQLFISAGAAAFLGLYGFTMPACPPARDLAKKSLAAALGLDAFVLFRRAQMVVFFLSAMMLGGALQITNAFGGDFLVDFTHAYPDSFGVQHPILLSSISQMSETLFILTIPFFLQRFGIKVVMLTSIFAWVFRFGLFAYGDRAGTVDAGAVDDRVRDGVRLLQHLGLDVREPGGEFDHPRERAGPLHGHDERAGGLPRHHGRGRSRGPLHGGRRPRLAQHLARVRGYALVLGIVFPFVFRYKHDPAKMADSAVSRRRSPEPSA
jgi:NHS family xanthosine MFS transporter